MIETNLVELFAKSFKENWDKEAVEDYISQKRLTYGEYAAEIELLHITFRELGLQPGDVIAVCGKNSTAWSLAYMAALTYGIVIVPILDEFHPKDISHIVNHSEAMLFFCDSDIWRKMQFRDFEKLLGVVSLNDGLVIESKESVELSKVRENSKKLFADSYPEGFKPSNVNYIPRDKNALAELCYTSGTTSHTKGVMLSYNNLCGNVVFGRTNYEAKGITLKSTLCILPLAHTYGVAFNLLMQLEWGAKITFLGKIPSPNIILEACAKVKPTLLFLVPLVLEKIYKNKIAPILKKPVVAKLISLPVIGPIVYRVIGRKVYNLLGGSALNEVVIGGAAINAEVEEFFYKAKFPFLVGYGMTECAPLISYIRYEDFVPTSVGKALSGIMEVRICKENEEDETGEIQTRGENVMLGYYKEPEITAATFTEDNWLKTGDLGEIDSEGNIYIRGRSKTMLLGSSGENIYPEPIESMLQNMPFIQDCLILQRNKRLEAWVYPDYESMEKMAIPVEKLDEIMDDNRKTANSSLAKFESLAVIRISKEPFPKTPKRTIKRMDTIKMIEESLLNEK
ncbi:MAG: AMP-binding protein [Rikenellaceae bacterium]